MIVFGLVSSCFDLLTFGALRWIFRTDAAVFQTVWFVISLLTELVVVLVLRTHMFCLNSKPSRPFFWTSAIMAAVTLALPAIPGIDALFGFEVPSGALFGFSLASVVAYAVATEFTKHLFFAKKRKTMCASSASSGMVAKVMMLSATA